jgi:hypothetical protein
LLFWNFGKHTSAGVPIPNKSPYIILPGQFSDLTNSYILFFQGYFSPENDVYIIDYVLYTMNFPMLSNFIIKVVQEWKNPGREVRFSLYLKCKRGKKSTKKAGDHSPARYLLDIIPLS